MKRILAVVLALITVLSVSVLFASADDGAKVFVTVADKQGKLALAMHEIAVSDIDSDGQLTVNDALYAAHEQFYEGGAAAGYATSMTQYGLSLTKLWGVADGYNYGYMVNDVSAWSMTDPVKEGDYVAAYVFTDNKNLSDKYSFFDQKDVTMTEEDSLTLTLMKNDFDELWNPLVLPVAGAELTVDGQPTGVFTDVNGQATLSLTKCTKHLISAVAKDQVIVPPVCYASVCAADETQSATEATETATAATEPATEAYTADETRTGAQDVTEAVTEPATETVTEAPATKDQATKDQATKDQSNTAKATSSPKTSDETKLWLWVLISLVCLCGIVGAVIFYKKHYKNEK